MWLMRPPAMSNATTVTVTPSCWTTRPGWPLTVRSRSVEPGALSAMCDQVLGDLLAALDRAQDGADQAAAVGDHHGVGVEEADEGRRCPWPPRPP